MFLRWRTDRLCLEASRSFKSHPFNKKKGVEDKYLIDKNKNKPFFFFFFPRRGPERDVDKTVKPPPVIFPSRKLYAETDQIWFKTRSFYLFEGGNEVLSHRRRRSSSWKATAEKTKRSSHLTAFIYSSLILVTFAAGVLKDDNNKKEKEKERGRWRWEEETLAITTQELDLCVNRCSSTK